MSFDIFLQRFESGEAALADGDAIMSLLNPLIADRSGSWARIVTPDGEADVYGVDDPAKGLMVNHASGRAIWDVLFELSLRGGLAVMPVGRPSAVADPTLRGELPEGALPAEIVGSGADIFHLVEGT